MGKCVCHNSRILQEQSNSKIDKIIEEVLCYVYVPKQLVEGG